MIIPILKSHGFISYEDQLKLIEENKEHVQSIINYFNDDIADYTIDSSKIGSGVTEISILDNSVYMDRYRGMMGYPLDKGIFTESGLSNIADKNDILVSISGYPLQQKSIETFKKCRETLDNYYKVSTVCDAGIQLAVLVNLSSVKYYRVFKNCIECFSGTYFVEGDNHKSLDYVGDVRKEINSNFSEFRMQGYRLEHSYDYNTIHFRVSKKEK